MSGIPAAGAIKSNRGAKPGEKRGGRTFGSKDKAAVERESRLANAMHAATEAIGNDKIQAMSPLDVLAFVMRLMAVQGWWLKAAEIAKDMAPYVHPKLASTEVNDKRSRSVEEYTDEELVTFAGGFGSEQGVGQEEARPN